MIQKTPPRNNADERFPSGTSKHIYQVLGWLSPNSVLISHEDTASLVGQ